jgi:aminopeptidase N
MTGTDPYVPDHGDAAYHVVHYDLQLVYKPEGNRLVGEATLRCVALEELSRLRLDLHHLRVAGVRVDGRAPSRYTHRRGALAVWLAEPVPEGTEVEVRVKYSGQPKAVRSRALGDAGWEELTDGAIVAAQPHGAPSWFPCNDRPDDKATYDFTVSVPTGYQVAMSGEPVGTSVHGSSVTWRFRQEAPMASYLATCQIGRYAVIEQDGPVPLRVVAPTDVDGEGLDAAFGAQPQMMRFFESRFGAYPFTCYTTVITDDDLEIPLESQSLSTFGRNFCRDDWNATRLVAHELAHQWFGNAVTLRRWQDIWLHEGFACYAEWLWSEESGGDSVEEWARHHHHKLAGKAEDLVLADPGPDLMFDDRVYKRGALTLHALRAEVGSDSFFGLLQSWVKDHNGGSVTTEDFILHCQEETGRSLSELFDAWLYQEELPDLP